MRYQEFGCVVKLAEEGFQIKAKFEVMSDGSLFQIVAEEWLLTGAECETECET